VHCLYLCVQEIDSLEKFFDGTLYEILVKAATLHEDGVHIPEAHLGNLEGKRDVFSMRPDDFKRVQQLPHVAGTHMLARQDFVQVLVKRQLTMVERIVYVDLEGDILVISTID
jgi:hypothetical protein